VGEAVDRDRHGVSAARTDASLPRPRARGKAVDELGLLRRVTGRERLR
jgi:hypothetical protein